VLRTLNRIGMVIDKDKDSSRMRRKEGGWALAGSFSRFLGFNWNGEIAALWRFFFRLI
jgi:hypothetical protein